MKIQIALMAAVAATALASSAFAAASLGDVVQKGANADRVREKNQINVASAERIAKHCVDEAASKNLGVSVVIVDQFGTITYYYRTDGQGKQATESALLKARTTLNTRAPSKAQQNAVRSGGQSEARVISFGNFAQGGALPIVVEGQFLGAIGVGGMPATPPTWSDEICAQHALEAVLGPQPALLPDLPNPFAITAGGGGAPRPPGAANN